eukprot:Hpha_TRINITY_DN26612_c0_g1::TRINITY_DN26612_c0_g1_i1::g.86067::m.86067
MEIMLYMRCETSDRTCGAEVDAMGTVQNILDAARQTFGADVTAVSFAGRVLDPDEMIADSSLSAESTVHVLRQFVPRWTAVGAMLRISEDGRSAELTTESDPDRDEGDFVLALGDAIPAGASRRWKLRWTTKTGGIRSCGVTAKHHTRHNNHGSQAPYESISYEACDECVFTNLLSGDDESGVKADSFGDGDVVEFCLEKGGLEVLKNGKRMCMLEGIPNQPLYPFAGFYKSNKGDVAEFVVEN